MRRLTKLMGMVVVMLLAVSCTNRQQKTEKGQIKEVSTAWAGTYTGVTRAADCPGIYRMVATDGNVCEVMDKYLERKGIYISRGSVARNNDTVRIDDVPYTIGKDMLYNVTDTLYRISAETKLPALYTTQWMIENRKGAGSASLSCYFEGGKRKALFRFKGKEYKMVLNEKNTQENEYTDGKNSLVMETVDPAPLKETIPLFIEGKEKYEFTITSPVNQLFTSKNAPALDVLYMNDEGGHVVMLLSSERKNCRILTQTEASAKTAEYGNGNVNWSARGNRATLTIDNKKYLYTGQDLLR